MPAEKYAALILAAGFSTRMGRFKPLLPIPYAEESVTALECLVRLYGSAGVGAVAVVGGRREERALRAEAARLGCRFVHNPQAERGMFSSVCVGLEAVSALPKTVRGCFAHPVDIPLARRCTLHALLREAEEKPQCVLIPAYKGTEGHPPLLPSIYFDRIRAESGERGLRGALEKLPRAHVPVADSLMLMDMDVEAHYAAVCAAAPLRHALTPSEAEYLLLLRGVPARGMAHARLVGAVARKLAAFCAAAGNAVDPDLAEAGGLLHDMCKGEPEHEKAAGKALRDMGLSRAARLVEEHRDCALADHAPITEKELVYLADKYVFGDKLVPLRQRFGQKLACFSEDARARAAICGRLARAEALERRLQDELGYEPFARTRQVLQGDEKS